MVSSSSAVKLAVWYMSAAVKQTVAKESAKVENNLRGELVKFVRAGRTALPVNALCKLLLDK